MQSPDPGKPAITYPCRWSYKLIGHAEAEIRLAVDRSASAQFGDSLESREPRMEQSRTSSGGRFLSFNLTLRVDDEQERLGLFNALGEAPEILIVI